MELLQNALTTPGLSGATNPHIVAIHGLREAILIAKRTRDPTSGLALLQKVSHLHLNFVILLLITKLVTDLVVFH